MRFSFSDNPIMRAMGKVFDLMVLNFFFLLFSLPIVTAGAALTAMYSVTLRMAKNEEGYIVKPFVKAFKDNFKRATILWLMFLVVMIMVGLNIFITLFQDMIANELLSNFALVFFVIVGSVVLMMALYAFPMTARYEVGFKATLSNALLLAIGRLPYSFLLVALHVVPVIATFLSIETMAIGLFLWVFLGFAILAFLSSKILRRVFVILDPKEEDEEEDVEA